MTPAPYDLVVTPPARRALADELPEPVAAAVLPFITGALIERPRVVGKPLRGDKAGLWAARRGTYRVLYRIVEDAHDVVVVQVRHRRDAYR